MTAIGRYSAAGVMRDIGVDMTIDERPVSEFANISAQLDFDLLEMGFRSSDPYGVAYFDQMYASDSELNKSGTGSEELDEKIAELQKIGDGDEQIEAANELEKEFLALHGIMPTFNGPDIVATTPGLANFGAYGFADVPVENIGWENEYQPVARGHPGPQRAAVAARGWSRSGFLTCRAFARR